MNSIGAPVLLALASGLAGMALAAHHPLAPTLLPVALLICWAVFFAWPRLWLMVLPGALPVIALAPWSGWITFEEQDILVLAIATGGYARVAWQRRFGRPAAAVVPHGRGQSAFAWLLLMLFAVSTAISMIRGFADAGGLQFGWFQGYHESMNSLRLAKCFFAAALLLPLWHVTNSQDPQHTPAFLASGLVLGLAGAALAALWERLAFTGLLNFSSDYRTTGLFWEMHVGGAAFDGFLALAMPFAARELLIARAPFRWAIGAGICVLAAYASLTTFSRGVYVAVPIALAVIFTLHARQRHAAETNCATRGNLADASTVWISAVMLTLAFSVSAGWIFQHGGYRVAIALLGVTALLLPIARALRQMPTSHWFAAVVGGLLLAGCGVAVTLLLPKGAYIAYGLGFAFTATMLSLGYHKRGHISAWLTSALSLAGFIATAAALVLVAHHWGYGPALGPAAASAGGLLIAAVVAGTRAKPLWPESARWQAAMLCVMGLTIGIIGVFSGGAYMGDRFSTGGRDLDGRIAHWKLGTSMLQTTSDTWFGKGLGRFPANYFLLGDVKEQPGDYRLGNEGGNGYLRLAGGLHFDDHWAQIFRVTQRISAPGLPAKVAARVRTAMDVGLRFEICEKHLLYTAACMVREVAVKAAPGQWQTMSLEFAGDGVTRGAWYAPKLLAFSVAMGTRGGIAELDQLELSGPDGSNLLANGDFSAGLAHWFFSSDKHHLPWHIKNMFLHVMFDQGAIGLALWGLLIGGALIRLTVGSAKRHPLAPALAASMVGFLVVGAFDSLLDVPRVSTIFYLFALIGMTVVVETDHHHHASPLRAEPLSRQSRTTIRVDSGWSASVIKAGFALSLAAIAVVGLAAIVAIASGISPFEIARRTPAELLRHSKRWLAEKGTWASALRPPILFLQSTIERPPPAGPMPTLGKGQQQEPLAPQGFMPSGEPIPSVSRSAVALAIKADRIVRSTQELAHAIREAKAGEVILISPGRYTVNAPVVTGHPGTAQQTITVRAAQPGEVTIEFAIVEGFHVTQPYWVIENLTIRGVCKRDADCEHAFHVVGAARGTVLRNNHIEDFNAHIKVNGASGQWPDHGLVQFNTLTNRRPRSSGLPVTPFDLVGASGWLVADNLITDFVKAGGNQVSYGVFMKGASVGGRVERNLIVCTSTEISQAGNRIGISWGGGGSQASSCRDKICASEHTDGLAANNVIAHCNDAGIDINHSQRIALVHNTLINTAGVLVRGQSREVDVYGNLIEGRIRFDDEKEVSLAKNEVTRLSTILLDPDGLRLGRKSELPPTTPRNPLVPADFCNHGRADQTLAGATSPGVAPCTLPPR